MFAYILRRLLLAIPTLFGIFTLIFIQIYLMPGDPVRAVMRDSYRHAEPETIEVIRKSLGHDILSRLI